MVEYFSFLIASSITVPTFPSSNEFVYFIFVVCMLNAEYAILLTIVLCKFS